MTLILLLACGAAPEPAGPSRASTDVDPTIASARILDGWAEVWRDGAWERHVCSCGDKGTGEWVTTVVARDVVAELHPGGDAAVACAWGADRVEVVQREIEHFDYTPEDTITLESVTVEGFWIDADCPIQDGGFVPTTGLVVDAPRTYVGEELWLFGVVADRTWERVSEGGPQALFDDSWIETGEEHEWWRLEPLLTGPWVRVASDGD